MATRSGGGSASRWTPVWKLLGIAIIAVVLIALLAPRLSHYALTFPLVFLIFVIAAATAAAITFGALRSTGKAGGNAGNVWFEFGGAAAMFIIVLLLGLWFYDRPQPVTTTFYLRANGTNNLVSATGELTLAVPNDPRIIQLRKWLSDGIRSSGVSA